VPSLFFSPDFAVRFILALLVTISFEFLVYWLIFKKNPLKLFLCSVTINFITISIGTYFLFNHLINFYFLEVIVVFVESFLILFLMKIDWKKALSISFLANLVTALFSLYWQYRFRIFWSGKLIIGAR